MKTKTYYLILVAVAVILSAPALARVELPLPEEAEPEEADLIGRPNPTLAGIEKLHIVILPPDAEPKKDGLVWRKLEAKVINKLNEAGIKIMPGIAGNILNIDELRVYIDMLELKDSQKYVFRIQTALARAVYLPKESSWSIKSDVWQTQSMMQAVSIQDMPARVTDVVLQQIQAFIPAYLAANPPGRQPADAGTGNAVSATARKQQTKPAAKPQVAEQKYLASKNSKVFHKPECSSAKRISPKNLVGYNTRNEAIKAGKRPCKQCKP